MRAKIAKRSLEKREKLLQIAEQLFLKNGYEGVSVDEVTRRAGGSKTNIYSYLAEPSRAQVDGPRHQIPSSTAKRFS